MATHFVITATGPDRIGIVNQVTEILIEFGANVEESRMSRLGGEFALILLIALPEDKAVQFPNGIKRLEQIPLTVTVRPTDTSSASAFRGYVPYEIVVTGADHEGIIHQVARYLSAKGINIDNLETQVIYAAGTGTPIFSMSALVQTPASISISELRQNLAQIGNDTGTDIEVRLLV